jgi:hypothetical protein
MFQTFYNPLTHKMVTVVPTLLRDGLAGYSEDGSRIYIDIAVPGWMWTPLISHEVLEMVLTQQLGFEYKWAHQQATALEKYVAESLQINWEEYDEAYKRLLNFILQRDPKPPLIPDLDVHT